MKLFFVLMISVLLTLISCKSNSIKNEKSAAMTIENSATSLTLSTVDKFNAAFNQHDVQAVMNLMTEDCIFENTSPQPDGTRLVGAAAVRAYWEKFFTNNPDALFESEDVFAAGDRCVVR